MGKIFASFQNHHRDYSIIKNLYFIFITEKLGCPLVTQLIKNLPAMGETWVQSLGWEDPQPRDLASPERKEWLSTIVFFPENSMDRGAWKATVHGVAKSRTQLRNFHSCG